MNWNLPADVPLNIRILPVKQRMIDPYSFHTEAKPVCLGCDAGLPKIEVTTLAPGIDIRFNPLISSNRIWVYGGQLVVRNRWTLDWRLRGINWHEAPNNCPTWTEAAGCCCDVDQS
jgi:hypothetical protein